MMGVCPMPGWQTLVVLDASGLHWGSFPTWALPGDVENGAAVEERCHEMLAVSNSQCKGVQLRWPTVDT